MRLLLQIFRRGLLTGSAFAMFFLVGGLLSYVVLPLVRICARTREEGSRRCRRVVARTWVHFHDYMRLCGLLAFDARATRIHLPPGGAVVVANHPTLIDVTALVAVCPELVFVAKRSLFRNPLVGPLLRACDHIESGEGVFAGAAVVDEALARLARGACVLVFPEGTRSPRSALGPLHPGAFEIACRAGVPLIPVLIRCDPPALMRGQPWHDIPDRRVRVTASQLSTVVPGTGRGAAAAAREAVRAQLAAGLAPAAELEPFTPEASPLGISEVA